MKIINFKEFLSFADDMQTRYKFYRVEDNRIQAFMVGRNGIILWSEIEKDSKIEVNTIMHGFLETELTKEEIGIMGLE